MKITQPKGRTEELCLWQPKKLNHGASVCLYRNWSDHVGTPGKRWVPSTGAGFFPPLSFSKTNKDRQTLLPS